MCVDHSTPLCARRETACHRAAQWWALFARLITTAACAAQHAICLVSSASLGPLDVLVPFIRSGRCAPVSSPPKPLTRQTNTLACVRVARAGGGAAPRRNQASRMSTHSAERTSGAVRVAARRITSRKARRAVDRVKPTATAGCLSRTAAAVRLRCGIDESRTPRRTRQRDTCIPRRALTITVDLERALTSLAAPVAAILLCLATTVAKRWL